MLTGDSFSQHRERLYDIISKHNLNKSFVYLESGNEPSEKHTECEERFLIDGLFYWISGWKKPNSAIILNVEKRESILLTPLYDNEYAIWNGKIPIINEIQAETGVDKVIIGAQFGQTLRSIAGKQQILTDTYFDAVKGLRRVDTVSIITLAGLARRVKFDHEIECLRRAAEITSDAIVATMRATRPGINEQIVEATFLYNGTILGGRGLSFPTIAASGANCAFLHYMDNSKQIDDGDLVLIDCGMRYNGYCGDVTRTFPANGKFSPDQTLVYNLLLEMQQSLINEVRPNAKKLDLEEAMVQGIFDILTKIGICQGPFNSDAARLFIPHSLSHHVGASEHDLVFNYDAVPSMGMPPPRVDPDKEGVANLAAGMVITIEPGIYFNPFLIKEADPQLGINIDRALELATTVGGIRIEDDILVTDDGRCVLSTCPRQIEEIEAIMQKKVDHQN